MTSMTRLQMKTLLQMKMKLPSRRPPSGLTAQGRCPAAAGCAPPWFSLTALLCSALLHCALLIALSPGLFQLPALTPPPSSSIPCHPPHSVLRPPLPSYLLPSLPRRGSLEALPDLGLPSESSGFRVQRFLICCREGFELSGHCLGESP